MQDELPCHAFLEEFWYAMVLSRVRLEQEVHGWVIWVHHSLGCQPDRCPGSPEYSACGSDNPGWDINPTQQRKCIWYLRYVYGVKYDSLRSCREHRTISEGINPRIPESNCRRNRAGRPLQLHTRHGHIHLVIPSILDRSDMR